MDKNPTAPEKQSDVRRCIESLNRYVDFACEQIDCLEEKLASVLEQPEIADKKDSGMESVVPLAGNILAEAIRVMRFADRIKDICNRLQL